MDEKTRNDLLARHALEAAHAGDWKKSLHNYRQLSGSYDIWDQIPIIFRENHGGLPDEATNAILDELTSSRSPEEKNRKDKDLRGFLAQYMRYSPPNASHKTLWKIAHLATDKGLSDLVSSLTYHHNWDPDEHYRNMSNVGKFWDDYETSASPDHFATIKHYMTGQPVSGEEFHGGKGASLGYTDIFPHMAEYSKLAQEKVLQDPALKIKHFGGEPHVKVYRGVSGDYAQKIMQSAGLDKHGYVDKKVLNIPTSHLSSWSTSPEIAHSFSVADSPYSEEKKGVTLEKWMPVKNLLHSGYHALFPGHSHAASSEKELVFGHSEPRIKIPSSSLHEVTRPERSTGLEHRKVEVRQPGGALATPVKKSEPSPDKAIIGPESQVVADMLGHHSHLQSCLEAAQFLAGGREAPLDKIRRALWEQDGEPEKTALFAYGLEPTDHNVKTLCAVMGLNRPLRKSLEVSRSARVEAGTPDAQPTAEAVQRAFRDEFVVPVKLTGKHSQGSLLARDEQGGGGVFLLKPGSGAVSPAAGVAEESASQSRREVAFYAVASDWGLGAYVPETHLVTVDGKEYAAIKLLPWNHQNLDRVRREDTSLPKKAFGGYLPDGTLHKWGALDFVTGQPDRHAGNLMIGENNRISLIDAGSAFAGADFDPAHDKNSFVPYYLRYAAPAGFNNLSTEDRLKYMPRLSAKSGGELAVWLEGLDPARLKAILSMDGIDPEPSLSRLARLKMLAQEMPTDLAVNRIWVDT